MACAIACGVMLACGRDDRAADGSRPSAAAPPPTSARPADTATRPSGAAAPAAPSVASAAPGRPMPAFAFESDVGVVQSARDTTLCLTMADAGLAAGDTLLVVSTGERGEQGVAVARVDGAREQPCAAPGDERGSVSIERASFYALRVVRDSLLGEPAIAVRTGVSLAADGRFVTGDLDGDGRPEHFAQCISREGIHLRVVTRAAGGEIERWRAYFYVPYDLEPTCDR